MHENERLENILSILRKHKHISNEKLCKLLFCSQSTLRRDLIKLERSNHVKRGRGSVSLNQSNIEFSWFYRENVNKTEKEYIADFAKDFITSGQCIFMDGSSSVYMLCPHLANKDLVVVTNSLKTAISLNHEEGIQVFTPGGQVKSKSTVTVGEWAVDFLSHFNADVAFLSCRGITTKGVFEADFSQAVFKQEMIKNAKKTIFLVDSSKFDSNHFLILEKFQNIDVLITDKKPRDEYLEICEKYDCEVIY